MLTKMNGTIKATNINKQSEKDPWTSVLIDGQQIHTFLSLDSEQNSTKEKK